MTTTILIGDVREQLRTLADNSVHCIVTSPPYWGLRDYGVDGQIGLEASPAEFIAAMVDVFEELRRVLRPDGTCWMNMGDSYATGAGKVNTAPGGGTQGERWAGVRGEGTFFARGPMQQPNRMPQPGLKPKDLCMMPHRLAIALQDAGWWVRQDIVWHKPNPMPESTRDRCTKAHEYIFLLTKSERYYYDQDAIRTPFADKTTSLSFATMDGDRRQKYKKPDGWDIGAGGHGSIHRAGREKGEHAPDDYVPPAGANKRSVWTIATAAYAGAHFATFPPEIPETCIKAGCPPGGIVLDPFFGAGTTGLVAERLQRDCIGIELNPAYAEIARRRIKEDSPLFADVIVVDGASALEAA